MGAIINPGKKAAKRQAAVTLKVASDQAAADRLTAQGAQQTRETMIQQNQATLAASTLLSKPQEQVDVNLAAVPNAEIDPTTGRRRTARSSFMSTRSSGSGIKIQ